MLKPGCGCALMLLAVVNLFFFAAVIMGTVRDTFSLLGGFAMSIIFLANTAAVLTVGWGTLRQRRRVLGADTDDVGGEE